MAGETWLQRDRFVSEFRINFICISKSPGSISSMPICSFLRHKSSTEINKFSGCRDIQLLLCAFGHRKTPCQRFRDKILLCQQRARNRKAVSFPYPNALWVETSAVMSLFFAPDMTHTIGTVFFIFEQLSMWPWRSASCISEYLSRVETFSHDGNSQTR